MTQQPLSPEQEEQVRRALAAAARAEDAAAPATMPPAVAARLDVVLAELVQGRTQTDAVPEDHDELARHRSRRRLNVLVAAAALAVIATAGGVVLNDGFGGGGSDNASTASSGAQGGTAYDQSAPQPEAAAPSASPGSGSGTARTVTEPRLRSNSLASDVRRVARSVNAGALVADGTGKHALRSDAATCDRPTAPRDADVVDVLLDGEPATLVLDHVVDGAREARVYSCADPSTPTATTTVPAP